MGLPTRPGDRLSQWGQSSPRWPAGTQQRPRHRLQRSRILNPLLLQDLLLPKRPICHRHRVRCGQLHCDNIRELGPGHQQLSEAMRDIAVRWFRPVRNPSNQTRRQQHRNPDHNFHHINSIIPLRSQPSRLPPPAGLTLSPAACLSLHLGRILQPCRQSSSNSACFIQTHFKGIMIGKLNRRLACTANTTVLLGNITLCWETRRCANPS